MSYLLATDDWVPKAWINSCVGREHPRQPVVDNVDHPLPTQEAADAIAKKLAMEWIDAQFPRSPIDCGDDRLNRTYTERMREWTMLRLKPN